MHPIGARSGRVHIYTQNQARGQCFFIFEASSEDIRRLLGEYGVTAQLRGVEELVRYRYPEETGQVRLILKCSLDGGALIVKFKKEEDVTRELIEAQSRFSERLAENGVLTADFLKAGDAIALERELNGYHVCVTVERFRDGEIMVVNGDIAEKTGRCWRAPTILPSGKIFTWTALCCSTYLPSGAICSHSAISMQCAENLQAMTPHALNTSAWNTAPHERAGDAARSQRVRGAGRYKPVQPVHDRAGRNWHVRFRSLRG